MAFINSITSIGHQPSFGNRGFSTKVQALPEASTVITPDFKEYIDSGLIRRMTDILKMSVACANYCLKETEKEIEGVIVGTGLGCLTDTRKFLEISLTAEGLLSPTSFIQSTHNTLAGQISLINKLNAYNTTYSQNTVSFELALQDALLCLNEGMDNILVGAADEKIAFLEELAMTFNWSIDQLASGATFAVLSSKKTAKTLARIARTTSIYKPENAQQELHQFLQECGIDINSTDRIYYSGAFNPGDFQIPTSNICVLAGLYPSNAAFAFHLAADEIATTEAKQILIYNHLNPVHLGLTLIQKA